MLYAAKCYWPGVTKTNLEVAAERAVRTTAGRDRVAYLGCSCSPLMIWFSASSKARPGPP
jgi:hypothetical protein